jgi:hypothetical protein
MRSQNIEKVKVNSMEIRPSIRLVKNEIIQKYQNFRIDTTENPYYLVGRSRPCRILFILSHMRSGSSLLTHILNSNPDIIGYGETHIQYTSEIDFKRLMLKVYWEAQEFRTLRDIKNLSMNQKYILDKVLHNNKFADDEFLLSDNLYSIFLLREPRRSLASIASLKPHLNEEQILNYYAGRLSMLEQYARLIDSKKRSLLITYHQMIKQTDLVFEALQKFLEIGGGFSEDYQLLKTTGMRHVGDHQGNINAGRIVRTPRPLETQLSEDAEKKGRESFERCGATLSHYCSTVDSLCGS